jgi:osmotically-inducible protein OsmY
MNTDESLSDVIALQLHRLSPKKPAVNVRVQNGAVYLHGKLDVGLTKEIVRNMILKIAGVHSVNDNELLLTSTNPTSDAVLKAAIEKAIEWHPGARHDGLTITVTNGNVKLSGTVNSGFQRGCIYRAVEAIPGVISIINQIKLQG